MLRKLSSPSTAGIVRSRCGSQRRNATTTAATKGPCAIRGFCANVRPSMFHAEGGGIFFHRSPCLTRSSVGRKRRTLSFREEGMRTGPAHAIFPFSTLQNGPIPSHCPPISPSRLSVRFNSTKAHAAADYDDLCHVESTMDVRKMYRYLHLVEFTKEEVEDVFDQVRNSGRRMEVGCPEETLKRDLSDDERKVGLEFAAEGESEMTTSSGDDGEMVLSDDGLIGREEVSAFLLRRIHELEREGGSHKQHRQPNNSKETLLAMKKFADEEATLLLNHFRDGSTPLSEQKGEFTAGGCSIRVSKANFTSQILSLGSTIDSKRTLPISLSMLLVGSSVGIVTPVMPFVVENLGLTPGQYGMVVSSFAVAKMVGNIPSAILVERHGRKPYLVNSLTLVGFGVFGIGLATQFEHLILCRLLTGFGVAALSTAATMTIADISTPLNRASTMAPIMSAFAAGTALGPALGGILADQVGISPTFYIVGSSYLGLTLVNRALLVETKVRPMKFPWHEEPDESDEQEKKPVGGGEESSGTSSSISNAVRDAVGQWAPLMSDSRVRNVVIMNGFYWFALAGSQMTLLPLMLTNPEGLAMSATDLGGVYMGMSLVQVVGNPVMARFVDRMGKAKAMVVGCTLISSSMAFLPFCTDMNQMGGTLFFWALGSTMLSTAPVAYVSDLVEAERRAQAIALLRTAGDVGFLLGATGTGALADVTGNLDAAMQSSAGLLLTATGWFATRQWMRQKLEGS